MNARNAKKHTKSLLKAIGRYSESGGPLNETSRSHFVSIFLNSAAVKLTALRETCRLEFPSADTELAFAQNIRFDMAHTEPVRWTYKSRGNGGDPRLVCDPPPALRIVQWMAKELIQAQFTPRAHIFDWRGRGKDRLIRALTNALEIQGWGVVLADVRHCFASVNPDALYCLDMLPEAMIRNALDTRRMRYRQYGEFADSVYTIDDETCAPSGLMEGSAASNKVLAVLLDDLPDHLPRNVRTFVFSDNVAIVGRDQEECSQAAQALAQYFAGHRAGPFHIKPDIFDARLGFTHLGYHLIKSSDGVSIEPSDKNLDALCRRMIDRRSAFSGLSVETIAAQLIKGAPACTPDFQLSLEDEVRYAGYGLEQLPL